MDYKRIMKIYNEGLNDFVYFAENQADYLSEAPKQQFIAYKTKEIKQRIELEHKREAFVRKSANKLYSLALKEMKRELNLKRKKHRQEMLKLGVLRKLRGNAILPTEQIIDCKNCEHCFVNDKGNLCCAAYNLEFQSDDLNRQFIECFCTSYSDYIPEETDETENSDEVADNNKPTEETIPDSEPTDEPDNVEPSCCKDCKYYLDNDDGCYCTKYDQYLNDCEVDNNCCCEADDFLDDTEEEEE